MTKSCIQKRYFTFPKTWAVVLFFLLLSVGLSAEPADCKAYFSTQDQLADKLIELIDQEEESIKVAIYCITHFGIAKSLIQAHERGVDVEVVVDPFSIKSRSSIHRLIESKIPLFVWDESICVGDVRAKQKRKALMHAKFCIFGNSLIWTGSFNFTNAANQCHQENVVTVESQKVAEKYLEQFSYMKLYESRPYQEYVALHPKKKRAKKVR